MERPGHVTGLWLLAALGVAVLTHPVAAGKPPANAPQPRAVSDLKSALAQTAAVVEGTVAAIRYEYSAAEGPWTQITLTDVRAHAGSAPAQLRLRQFGGRTPNGKFVVASELPVFVQGKRYLVFLRNTAWNLSPVVGDLALRVETVDRAEVLVTADGAPVTGIDAGGLVVGQVMFGPHELDGSPPKRLAAVVGGRAAATAAPSQAAAPQAVGGAASTAPARFVAAVAPLDRAAFVAAVGARAQALGMAVAGTFWDQPAGAFRWTGNRTAAAPGAAADARTAAPAANTFEPDPTKPR